VRRRIVVVQCCRIVDYNREQVLELRGENIHINGILAGANPRYCARRMLCDLADLRRCTAGHRSEEIDSMIAGD
jgi:hypothetical protein